MQECALTSCRPHHHVFLRDVCRITRPTPRAPGLQPLSRADDPVQRRLRHEDLEIEGLVPEMPAYPAVYLPDPPVPTFSAGYSWRTRDHIPQLVEVYGKPYTLPSRKAGPVTPDSYRDELPLGLCDPPSKEGVTVPRLKSPCAPAAARPEDALGHAAAVGHCS